MHRLMYHDHGYLSSVPAELDLSLYGLSSGDTNTQYDLTGIINIDKTSGSLAEVENALKKMYAGSLTAEFLHLKVQYWKFVQSKKYMEGL